MASTASAQTTQDTGVQDIVVTAQKREQKLSDVPITLSAYSGATLEKQGLQDLHDISVRTPGFYFQNQSVNNPGIVMRGITDDSTDPFDEPRVSIYQDGVSISQIPAAFTQLFDIERVEIAKGPQTTLYGRSALTGAVNVIQNKATEKGLDWMLKGEVGNSGYTYAEGMLNLPINDMLALRFSGVDKQRDGYIKNLAGGDPLNGVNTAAGRIALNFHPNNSFNDDLLVNYERDRPSGTDFKNKTFNPSNPTTGAVLGNTSPFSAAALDTSAAFGNQDLHVHREVGGVTNIATWKINDAFKLTSTSAYRKDDGEELFDPDGFSFPVLTVLSRGHGSELSQDFRVNWDAGGPFSAFAGVSAFGDDAIQTNTLAFDERTALGLVTGALNRNNPNPGPVAAYTNASVLAAELQGVLASGGLNVPAAQLAGLAANLNGQHVETYQEQSHTEAYDAYVDGTWRLTSKLEISAGLRYSTEDKVTKFASYVADRSVAGGVIGVAQTAKALGLNPASTGNCTIPAVFAANQLCQVIAGLATPGATSLAFPAALPFFALQSQPTAGNGQKNRAVLSDDGLSWRLTARYALTPELNAYATYARGRRPEELTGASPSAPFGAARFTVAPSETLDNYEAGLKGRYFGGRLKLDGAIYLEQYKHFQTTVLQGTNFVTTDAGNAQTYGFEGDAEWTVNAYADLFANYAYTHGRFQNGIYDGNHFRLTPDHSVTIGGSLHTAFMGGVVELLPTYSWRSKLYFNDDNANPAIVAETAPLILPLQYDQYQKAYGLLDLRLSYTADGGRWKVEAFATNLANTHYLKDAGNTGEDLGLPTYIPGEPRFYGLSLTIRR
jgi:outer membrane receptor protein involved in Fe transport